MPCRVESEQQSSSSLAGTLKIEKNSVKVKIYFGVKTII